MRMPRNLDDKTKAEGARTLIRSALTMSLGAAVVIALTIMQFMHVIKGGPALAALGVVFAVGLLYIAVLVFRIYVKYYK